MEEEDNVFGKTKDELKKEIEEQEAIMRGLREDGILFKNREGNEEEIVERLGRLLYGMFPAAV